MRTTTSDVISPAAALRGAVLLLAALPAAADGRNPGSLLVFPEYDHSSGRQTLVTITNAKLDAAVRVHFKYVSGEPATRCLLTNSFEDLTPGDSVTVLTGTHSPALFKRGFLYVLAVDATGTPISFNHLAGDAVRLDGTLTLQHTVAPFTFRSPRPLGAQTDGDGDGVLDLDDGEYEQAPGRMLVPRFLGQTPGAAGYESDVVFLALSGGLQFTTIAEIVIYNDDEDPFSAQHSFACWEKRPLLEVSEVFGNAFLQATSHAAPEVLGWPQREAGWFWVDGGTANSTTHTIHDPAVLVVLSERSGLEAGDESTGELPFVQGTQPNGDLLPTLLSGDGG
jgi:hypothetical protein